MSGDGPATGTQPGMTLTGQFVADPVATLRVGEVPITDLSQRVVDTPAIQQAVLSALCDIGEGKTPRETRQALDSAGVNALGGYYRSLAISVLRGDDRTVVLPRIPVDEDVPAGGAVWDFLMISRQLGQGMTTVGLLSDTDDILSSYPRIIAASQLTPTVELRISPRIREMRADQCRDLCRFITALSQGCDVRLVGGSATRAWLTSHHGKLLPGCVNSQCSNQAPHSPEHPTVRQALASITVDSRQHRVLRQLHAEPTWTLSKSALESMHEVSRSTVAKVRTKLKDAGLICESGRRGNVSVTLLPAGAGYVEAVEQSKGFQQSLPSSVNGAGHPDHNRRVNTTRTGGEEGRSGAEAAPDVDHPQEQDWSQPPEAVPELLGASSGGDFPSFSANADGGKVGCSDACPPEPGGVASESLEVKENAGGSDPSAVSDCMSVNPLVVGDGSRDRQADFEGKRAEVRYLSHERHAAVAGAAEQAGLIALSDRVGHREDCREPYVSYDAGRQELVVSVEARSVLQLQVTLARGLTDGRVWATALEEGDRLTELVRDADQRLLRAARQLGWLSDDLSTGEDYWECLVGAREHLLNLTTELKHGEYDNYESHCGKILRLAHGLSGTIVHILDRIGVKLVKELTLPDYQQTNEKKKAGLAETITHHLVVTSRYGDHSGFRQLLERREEKRQTAMNVRVDVDDPLGSVIGHTVVSGLGADDLAAEIKARMKKMEPHEDAPEVGISLSVATDDEIGFMTTLGVLERMCQQKTLLSTRTAAAVLDGLTDSPYDLAFALSGLSSEEYRREIRLDEVRFALAHLASARPKRILPGAKPSVSKLLGALLQAERPVTKHELADRAGVSQRSVRRNLPELEAVDLVRMTDEGLYRIALPFATADADERGETILPAVARDRIVTAEDIVAEVAMVLLEKSDRGITSLPEEVFSVDVTTRLKAYHGEREFKHWVEVALSLGMATIEVESEVDLPAVSKVTLGSPTAQQSLEVPDQSTGAA